MYLLRRFHLLSTGLRPSLNANYNARFTCGTAVFPFLCCENITTTTISDNGQKKKLTRGPPQIDLLNKKTQPNKQTKTKKKNYLTSQIIPLFQGTGTSANAGPHYQKLYARVTHIWGNRGGQSNRSAMRGPRPGRTALVITVPPASGKYAWPRISSTGLHVMRSIACGMNFSYTRDLLRSC